jgi:hypothetical protein
MLTQVTGWPDAIVPLSGSKAKRIRHLDRHLSSGPGLRGSRARLRPGSDLVADDHGEGHGGVGIVHRVVVLRRFDADRMLARSPRREVEKAFVPGITTNPASELGISAVSIHAWS